MGGAPDLSRAPADPAPVHEPPPGAVGAKPKGARCLGLAPPPHPSSATGNQEEFRPAIPSAPTAAKTKTKKPTRDPALALPRVPPPAPSSAASPAPAAPVAPPPAAATPRVPRPISTAGANTLAVGVIDHMPQRLSANSQYGQGCYVKLYERVNIAPEPLDQGRNCTCNFFAVAKGAQMQIHKHYADDEKECDIITYPHATINQYCVLTKIHMRDIDSPLRDLPKEVRFEMIEWLGKHCGVEAVSGKWPSPRRVEVEELPHLGRRLSHARAADLLKEGNAILCQIVAGPGFNMLGPNEIWSCKPRYDENFQLLKPFYYHVVVLVDCGGKKHPVTFLNSAGKQFGKKGYGLIMLKDVRWFNSFKIQYPLKFLEKNFSGNCAINDTPTWRRGRTGASKTNGAASSSWSDGKQTPQDPRGSGTVAWQSKPRLWEAATSSSWRPPSTVQDRSRLNAPRWRQDNVAASNGKAAMQQETQGIGADSCRSGVAGPTPILRPEVPSVEVSSSSSMAATLEIPVVPAKDLKCVRSFLSSSLATSPKRK